MSKASHTKITLGEGLTLDLETLIASKLLVQANSGGGKSWALRRLLEQTHGHVQQIVLDPEGEFPSLREKHDYVLAAPTGGDTVADPRTAKLLAHRLLELKASAIIDLYELDPNDRIRFVKLFLSAMIDAPKSLWHPALVVLDEAHVYCPEDGKAESSEAVIAGCSRGRKRGFCMVLATQRISALSKGAAADLNNKLIGRCSLDVDMARASKELGFRTQDQQAQLRQLKPGSFFAFGPAISDTIIRGTMGPVITTHHEIGDRIAFAPPPPTARIKALLPKLADLPAEAEAEARTVADLQRVVREKDQRIRELEKAKPAPEVKVKEVMVDRAVPFVPQEELKAVVGAAELVLAAAKGLVTASKKAPPTTLSVKGTGGFQSGQRVVIRGQGGEEVVRVTGIARAPRPRLEVAPSASLSKAERSILRVLVQYPDGRTIRQVALMTNYASNGGGFRNAVSSLRTAGLIEGKDPLVVTAAGVEAAGPVEPLPSGRELLLQWKSQSSKAECLILETLEACPEPLSLEEIARATNYEANGGGFRNALSRLRTLELITGGTRGEPVTLAEELR